MIMRADEARPSAHPMSPAEHRRRHQHLLDVVSPMVARFLVAPGGHTVWEMMEWSHAETLRDDGSPLERLNRQHQHRHFDELAADWMAHAPHDQHGFTTRPVSELMTWAKRQTEEASEHATEHPTDA